MSAGSPARSRSRSYAKKIAAVLVFAAIVAASRYLQVSGSLNWQAIFAMLQQHTVLAPLAFIGLYALSVCVLLPTLPLNLGAGLLWGTVLGGTYASVGSILGAFLAFFLARKVLGQVWRGRMQNRLLGWMQDQFKRRGWIIVAFVRMNPVFPGPINFILGLTTIRWFTYCWSTALFLLPPTYFFAYVGGTFREWIVTGATPDLVRDVIFVSLGVTVLAAIAVVVRMGMERANGKAVAVQPDVQSE